MIGIWKHAKRYGSEASYQAGMEWLKPCSLVEDWGCGPAYSKKYREGSYIGIDGTEGFCDKVADLRTYKSEVPGIFMRHVLDHNEQWQSILENAIESFQERMSLIFFTPWAEKTHIKHYSDGIPVICFNKAEILNLIKPYLKNEVVIVRQDKKLYDTLFQLAK